MDYAAAQKLYVKHKSALTRAKKNGPEAVMTAVNRFYSEFESAGFPLPDRWADWERAYQDSLYELNRRNAGI